MQQDKEVGNTLYILQYRINVVHLIFVLQFMLNYIVLQCAVLSLGVSHTFGILQYFRVVYTSIACT